MRNIFNFIAYLVILVPIFLIAHFTDQSQRDVVLGIAWFTAIAVFMLAIVRPIGHSYYSNRYLVIDGISLAFAGLWTYSALTAGNWTLALPFMLWSFAVYLSLLSRFCTERYLAEMTKRGEAMQTVFRKMLHRAHQ